MRHAVRLRLGLARAEGGKLEIVKTPNADVPFTKGADAAPDDRRVGARVLPRLPEPPRRLRQRGDRQAAELGLRRGEPGLTGRARRRARRRSLAVRVTGRCIIDGVDRIASSPSWTIIASVKRVRAKKCATRQAAGQEAAGPKPRAAQPRARIGARARGAGRRAARRRSRAAEPLGDTSMRGASIIDWSPAPQGDRSRAGQPGLVRGARERRAAVRERPGRSRRASCSSRACRRDPDTKLSPLAWLALFDLHAARGRSRRVRPARDAVRPAVRALGAVVGRARQATRRRGQGARRRLHRAHRQADRGSRRRSSTGSKRALEKCVPRSAHRPRRRCSGFDDAGARLLADAARRGAQAQRTALALAAPREARAPRSRSLVARGKRGAARARGCCRSSCCNGRTSRRSSTIAPSNSRSRSSCRRRRGSRRRAPAGSRCGDRRAAAPPRPTRGRPAATCVAWTGVHAGPSSAAARASSPSARSRSRRSSRST